MDGIEFQVKYKQKIYAFDYGSEAYIFHTGILNGLDRKYGLKAYRNTWNWWSIAT